MGIPGVIFTFYCSSIKSKLSLNWWGPLFYFTFYCSSIKSWIWRNRRGRNRTLHSTVVLLKEESYQMKIRAMGALHSTVVLLKGRFTCRARWIPYNFTFYCSSIKSQLLILGKLSCCLFTFYCSSIKRWWSSAFHNQSGPFTFYCSSIKSPFYKEGWQWLKRSLHSTVVLLKDCT